jgi:hypothetical protein
LTIHQLLLFLIQQAITNPIEEFHRLHAVIEDTRRIAGAILPTQLSDAAQQIAVVVQAEQLVNRPVLCRIIRNKADKSLNKMRQRLQLLEAKVMETKGVRATTPKKAKGDGKKQPALKTVLKKGTAATGKKPTKPKAKTSTGNTPPSEN